MADGPKHRLLASAIALMCERGVHATGLTDLLAHSGTARASIYQHFPGGKAELFAEATYLAGRTIGAVLADLIATRDPVDVIGGIVDHWSGVLRGSDYAMGCPIMAAAEAGAAEAGIRAASSAVFDGWIGQLATALADRGVEPAYARSLAGVAISSLEGAIAQSRGARSTQPLDDVRIVLTRVIREALPV